MRLARHHIVSTYIMTIALLYTHVLFATYPTCTSACACRYYQVFKEMIWPGAVRNEMQLPPLSRCPVRHAGALTGCKGGKAPTYRCLASCQALLHGRTPQVLYLWGEEKNTMFHTAEAVALLNSTKGCLAAPVSGAAHFLHRQQPDAVWARVCPFVLGGGRPLI